MIARPLAFSRNEGPAERTPYGFSRVPAASAYGMLGRYVPANVVDIDKTNSAAGKNAPKRGDKTAGKGDRKHGGRAAGKRARGAAAWHVTCPFAFS